MATDKLSPNCEKSFDPGPLIEMTRVSPTARSTLLGLIRNVVERGPAQLREARIAWVKGRIEESARLLHTMRGTIGTLGAARFAAAVQELESAIGAQQIELIGDLFKAAERELERTVVEASAFLVQEARSNATTGSAQANPQPKPLEARTPMTRQEPKLPDSFEKVQDEIRTIRDEIGKLSGELEILTKEQLFNQALATLPSCLVVEDDELIAHVIVHLLTREGYRVERVSDGRAAQQAIEQAEEPPGLILLDVMLPYVDGYELIHLIREDKHWSDVPIVMLTAKQQENDIVRALDAGATDYVVKPFQPNELMARLRRILRKKR